MESDPREPEPGSEEQIDPLMVMLKRHRLQLMEHFDSIVLIATKANDGGSCAYHSRGGCLYANRGVVRDWLDQEDVASTEQTKRAFRESEDEE